MDYICKDFDSTLYSLSQVVGISEFAIKSILEDDWETRFDKECERYEYIDFPEDEGFSYDFGDYIYLNAFKNRKASCHRPIVHWFHGARTINGSDYLRYGILPLKEVYPMIQKMVDSIAQGLHIAPKECCSNLQNHNKRLLDFKLNDNIQGGPFAMLMYDAAASPDEFNNHSYIDEPEIISNYAYMLYDKEADIILSEFKKKSVPVIVEFIEPDDTINPISVTNLVTTSIHYLYRIIHKQNIGLQGNICFSNNGRVIPASSIVNVYKPMRQ